MTTTTLTPNATNNSFGSVIVGAATGHAATNDALDTSYVELTAGGGVLSLGLTTVAMPSGAVTKSVVVRLRLSATGTSGLSVRVTSGATQSLTFLPAAIANHSLAPQVLALSQTQVDALVVELFGPTVATTATPNVHEVNVDLTYALVPVANVTYPTGTPAIATSAFTATWTHTAGSDGGPQTSYQVKLFTAAQYGAGGFSADTSTAAYDSGVLLGNATSLSVGPVVTATTYRAYVRTAQTVNSVAHWSVWDFEGFTTSFASSSITSVTLVAVASPAGSYMEVTVARNTGTSAWDTVEVERSDDLALTWVPVRGATNPTVTETNTFVTTFTTNSLVVKDYEAPNGTTVTYRARATTATDVIGAFASSSATASWSQPDTVWLKDPHDPTLNVRLFIEEMPQPTRPVSQGVFEVIGAEFPLIVSDVRRSRVGTFVAQTQSLLDGSLLDASIGQQVKLLQFPADHPWGSKYIALGDVQQKQYDPSTDIGQRGWNIAYVQVAQPADQTEY